MAWNYIWTNKSTGWTRDNELSFGNAQEAYTIMRNNGFTHNAACGVLGNWMHESYMNPGQWQIGYSIYSSSSSCGFGLGQWTKWTKVSDYVGSTAEVDMANGESQMNLFLSDTGQWGHGLINTSGWSNYYGIQTIYFDTLADYAADSTHTASELAVAFYVQWERGAKGTLNTQTDNAEWYADNISEIVTGQHKVTVNVTGNGTASASPTYAALNTIIQLTETPDDGDAFLQWEVNSGDISIDENNRFYMPDTDVEITAVFTSLNYSVTVNVSGNGSAYATPRTAIAGTTITLHETPNSGATFKGWNIVSGEITISTDNTFTMPDSNVIIIAEFTGLTPTPTPAGKIESSGNWWMYMRPTWTW